MDSHAIEYDSSSYLHNMSDISKSYFISPFSHSHSLLLPLSYFFFFSSSRGLISPLQLLAVFRGFIY